MTPNVPEKNWDLAKKLKSTPKIEADKELDEILLELTDDSFLQGVAKARLLAWKDKAFRAGQLDCQKAGDPTNHKYFKEACNKAVVAARIDEITRVYGKPAEHWNNSPQLMSVSRREVYDRLNQLNGAKDE